jgi:hypothetical protein
MNNIDFYELGKHALRHGLTIKQVTDRLIEDPASPYSKLKLANDEQVDYFVHGLRGERMPVKKQTAPEVKPPVVTEPVVVPEEPEPAAEITHPDLSALEGVDLQAELELLKKLVSLLEARLNQPVNLIVNTPKLKESRDEFQRNADDNLSGKVTRYIYEE